MGIRFTVKQQMIPAVVGVIQTANYIPDVTQRASQMLRGLVVMTETTRLSCILQDIFTR